MNGDDYMELLLERREQYYAQHGQPTPGFPALPEWFIRPGDENLVELPAPPAPPKPQRRPRTYRTAQSLTEQRDRLIAARDHILAITGVPDRAAAGGEALGRKRTARQAVRSDNALRRYVDLDDRIRKLNNRIALANAREQTR